MSAISVEDLDSRSKRYVLAKDSEHWPAFDDPAAECVLCLEANDQDCVRGIRCTVREVVQNSSTLGHSRRCDDDLRTVRRVQRLRLFDLPRVAHEIELE